MSKYEPRVSILVPPIDDPYGAPHPVADKPIDVTCWTCHDCGKQGTGDGVHTCSPQVVIRAVVAGGPRMTDHEALIKADIAEALAEKLDAEILRKGHA